MRAKLISYKLEKDRYGLPLYHFFFSTMKENGSYDMYTGPKFINFRRWRPVIDLIDKDVEIWFDNLTVHDERKRLISADSAFFYYRKVWPQIERTAI